MDEQPVDCELGTYWLCYLHVQMANLTVLMGRVLGLSEQKAKNSCMTHSRVKCYRNVMYSFLLCCLQLIYHTEPIGSKLACNV